MREPAGAHLRDARLVDPTAKVCGECGTALTAETPSALAAAPAERRLVSVLVADLVGFTTTSEGRDAEETRELLSRYFQTARTLIERSGGTVEKFIGDAVMAVWGTPVTQEDDAEQFALTLFEQAESLRRRRDVNIAPLLAEAREIFERLEATPWLERCDAAEVPPATIAAPAT